MTSLVLATGFGPFETQRRNPSGELALGLAADPPPGVEVVAQVLPVSFRRARAELEQAMFALEGRNVDLMLLLGVQRGPGWRLETNARSRLLGSGRSDNDGIDALEATADLLDSRARPSALDVGALALMLQESVPEPVSLSFDAGGFVCESTYAHALALASRMGSCALFVHVPRSCFTSVPVQVERMRSLLLAALGDLGKIRQVRS